MSEEEKVVAEEVKEETPVTEAAPEGMEAVVRDPDAPVITMKKLLEAGAHFGHQTRRWNPKMKKYIYGARNSVHILDLSKTAECIEVAYKAMKEIVDNGGKVLFVGTKKQCVEAVEAEALRSGSFYITNRWLGGTLTNFRTIQNRIKKLRELETASEDGSWDKLPKKEVALLKKELAKLQKNLEGIKEMRKLPNAVVLVDPTIEHNAVAEAHKLGIPVFAICDTSDDPDLIDFPIPSNNDATSAIKLIIGALADAVVEARGGLTEIAHTVDEGEEATMADAIRVADIAAEQHRAAVRAARKAREERYAKMQAERAARFAAKREGRGPRPEKKVEEPKAEEAPVVEEEKDDKKED